MPFSGGSIQHVGLLGRWIGALHSLSKGRSDLRAGRILAYGWQQGMICALRFSKYLIGAAVKPGGHAADGQSTGCGSGQTAYADGIRGGILKGR